MRTKIALLSLILSAVAHGADIELGKSVISATGFETAQKDTVKNVSVVTAQEIEEKNYQSVTDVLKDIPSVNIIGDSSSPKIDMRGQGKDNADSNVQILIDGVTINTIDSSHGSTPLNTVAVENIERIEVIPGGGAILYGSGTRGGIINIITKTGAGYQGGSIGAEYTSYGTKKGNVSYGTTLGKLGVSVDYLDERYRGFRDEDESDNKNFQTTLNYDLAEDKKLTFKYLRFEEKGTYPTSLTRKQINEDREQSGYASGILPSEKEIKKNEFSLKYEQKINDKIDFNILTSYHDMNMVTHEYKDMNQVMDMDDTRIAVKPKMRVKYRENDELIFGYDYVKAKLDRKSTGFIKADANLTKETNSLFVLNKNNFGKLEFTQGFRYEYADYDLYRKYSKLLIDKTVSEDNFALELVTNYLYSDTGNIYARIERGFTSPKPTDLFDRENNQYTLNDLKSEKYLTYEIGARDYIYDSLVGITGFYTTTEDEIYKDTHGINFNFKNIGKTERYGVELSAEQYFDKLTLREGYSYIKTKIKETASGESNTKGKEIGNVPNHKLSLSLDYKLNDKVSLSSTTVYSAKYYLNNSNTGGKQNSYTVTNVTINYYPIPTLKLYTGINNIFNEKYYDSVSMKGNEYMFDPATERNFVFGFKYNF
ncbi:TonB-dependent receptor [Fusobacterium sp.]|uniref:TonB-dependent receptor n=1 Tax=Fusobacterium sp. TaxID=68766 RepID=UPI0025BD61CD|nr:TonB-dependent receptor [Fusobacterium sp.]